MYLQILTLGDSSLHLFLLFLTYFCILWLSLSKSECSWTHSFSKGVKSNKNPGCSLCSDIIRETAAPKTYLYGKQGTSGVRHTCAYVRSLHTCVSSSRVNQPKMCHSLKVEAKLKCNFSLLEPIFWGVFYCSKLWIAISPSRLELLTLFQSWELGHSTSYQLTYILTKLVLKVQTNCPYTSLNRDFFKSTFFSYAQPW